MSWLRLALAALAMLLAVAGARRIAAALRGRDHARTDTAASVYVFGRLARAGDASSFVVDRRWRRVSVGRGPRRAVRLVVVPGDAPPSSLRTHADVATAEARGSVFVLDAMCTVPTARAMSFPVECATRRAAC